MVDWATRVVGIDQKIKIHLCEHRRCRMCVLAHTTYFYAGGVRFFCCKSTQIQRDSNIILEYKGNAE